MWGRTESKSSGLDGVLADYKKISEAPNDPADTSLYKSLDERSGIVYLIHNPASWSFRIDEFGKITRIRPLPISQGKLVDLPSEKPRSAPALQPWGDI